MTPVRCTHAISLQYQVRTSRAGYRDIERLLPLLGEFQNAAVRHRQLLARMGVPTREILRHQNTGITDLRKHEPNFSNIARRLVESVSRRVNDAYSRAFTVQRARFPRTRSPHAFRTMEISEPANQHIQFSESGIAEIHIKGLPTLWFRTDHRISVLEQPRSIRITKHGRRLRATLVYQFPDYVPQPAKLKSCGIDPGVAKRLAVVDNQAHYRQYPGIDTTQHRKTVRRLKRRLQRCRDDALRDGRARWIDHRRDDGKTRRRFRWTTKPSRKYRHTLAQLQRVEHRRIKTLQAEEHRITNQIVQDHQLIAIEDTAIGNMTRSARGTVENPGKNVAQKRGLNRSILSQRWAAISSKLEYKARWYGRQFVKIPAAHTSQKCPGCGHIAAENRRTQDNFQCQSGRQGFNADMVAGENMRLRGVKIAAGAGNPAMPAPVNSRRPSGKKQRIRALQRPLLLFASTRT